MEKKLLYLVNEDTFLVLNVDFNQPNYCYQ